MKAPALLVFCPEGAKVMRMIRQEHLPLRDTFILVRLLVFLRL